MSAGLEVPAALIMALTVAGSAGGGGGQLARPDTSPSQARFSNDNPFRFDEQRWLATFRRHGAEIGRSTLSARVFVTGSGRYYVPVATERAQVMALRDDIVIAGQLVHIAARRDAEAMTDRLGRPPTTAELLTAHLLGTDDAVTLLRLATAAPNTVLSSEMPTRALELPELFFAGARPRRAIEVITEIKAALVPTSFKRLERDDPRSARARSGFATWAPRTSVAR